MRIANFFAISARAWRVLVLLLVLTFAACSPSDDVVTTTSSIVSVDTTEGRERPPSPSEEELSPRRQVLYTECDEGDDAACTELATLVDEDSDEHRFAVTCGGQKDEPVCAPAGED